MSNDVSAISTRCLQRIALGIFLLTVCAAIPSSVFAMPIIGWQHEVVPTSSLPSASSIPTVSRGQVAYTTNAPPVTDSSGVYLRNLGGVTSQIANLPDLGFWQPEPEFNYASVDAYGDVSFGTSIGTFASSGGAVTPLALPGITPINTRSETLVAVNSPTRSLGVTTFSGRLSDGTTTREALFSAEDGRGVDLVLAAGSVTPTQVGNFPKYGYTGTFDLFGRFAPVDWNERRTTWGPDMAFLGFSDFSNGVNTLDSSGIFIYTGFHTVEVVAESYTSMPAGLADEYFSFFTHSPSISNGRVAFTAYGDKGTRGVFLGEAGQDPVSIASTLIEGPDGFGLFSDFGGWVSVDGENVLFTASNQSGRESLFLSQAGVLSTVFDQDDFNKLIPFAAFMSDMEIGIQALAGNRLAFTVSGGIDDPYIGQHMRSFIIVSTGVIPEPGTAFLTALGLAFLITFKRNNCKQAHQKFRGSKV